MNHTVNAPPQWPTPFKANIVRELWLICDEPELASKSEYCVLLSSGEVIAVSGSNPITARSAAPALTWTIEGLRESPPALNLRPDVGAIITDLATALQLRDFTDTFFKGTDQ